MDACDHKNGELYLGSLACQDLAAEFGTPLYAYSQEYLEQQWWAFDQSFGSRNHQICYAVKANSNLAILHCLVQLGSGFDVVSGGELARVLKAGGRGGSIIFSGVGKQAWEIEAGLAAGIQSFNVESSAELNLIQTIAKAYGVCAPVSLRINPDVDAKTHPYIATGLYDNKFGLANQDALKLYTQDYSHINFIGMACHIGSQILTPEPYLAALSHCLELINQLAAQGIHLEQLDLGGGFGVCYKDEQPLGPEIIVPLLLEQTPEHLKIILEPGRALVANAGILLTKVLFLKSNQLKNFAIVDAAMNDLLRPSLYQAWHGISPVKPRDDGHEAYYDIVGPVCETGDFLGQARHLNLLSGDTLAVHSAGAYASVMSTNYNTRPRAAEVLINGNKAHLIRARETIEQCYDAETIPVY